jgi:hypothetical protein
MNKIIVAVVASAIAGGAAGAGIMHHTTTIVAEVPDPPPPVVQVDEQAIARDVTARLLAAQKAEREAAIAGNRKKNCAFWGPGFTPDC